MWDYSDKVLDLFYNPVNQGAISDPHQPGVAVVFGEVGSIACGDALRLHLKIQVETDTIVDARFQTFGCTSAIASSSALTEMVKGKTLNEALTISNQDIAAYLGGLPEAKMHCSVMGQEALEAAIFKYRGITVEHHDDDDGTLICTCYAITIPKVRRVIIENDLTSVEQVTHYIKAGGSCGSCLAGIEDILFEVQQQRAAVPERLETEIAREPVVAPAPLPPSPAAPPLGMTNLQKIMRIQQVLDEDIRPLLRADGGDVQLHDVDGDRVLVQLQGACGACSSRTDTLKYAIEARLQQQVLPSLVVVAV